MKLYINTSDSEKIIIGLDDKRFATEARQETSQKLLPFIVDTLKEHELEFKDITEIEINPGPGSFTGLRVGLSVANTIGWVLSIPVNGRDIVKDGPVTPTYE